MFDIVAPQKDELALPIKVEGIDDAEPRLTGPATARHVKPAAERETKYKQNQQCSHKERGGAG